MAKSLGPLTRAEVVHRMRSAIGKATEYVLGEGGRDPRLPHPGKQCDCTGAVAWGLGVDRYLPNGLIPHLPGGAWFETTNLYNDARSPLGFVMEVPWIQAQPGDLLVYPDRAPATGGPKRQGHVGVVSEVDPTGPARVVHCSASQGRRGDAIAETGVEKFRAGGAIVARVAWVT